MSSSKNVMLSFMTVTVVSNADPHEDIILRFRMHTESGNISTKTVSVGNASDLQGTSIIIYIARTAII